MNRSRCFELGAGLLALALLAPATAARQTQDANRQQQDASRQQGEKPQDTQRPPQGDPQTDERKAKAREQQQQQQKQDDAAQLEERKKAAREQQQRAADAQRGAEGQPPQPAAGRGLSERELSAVKRYVNDIRKHRDRTARIERLLALAKESGNTERVNALNELLRKEVARSDKQKQAAAGVISPETMRQIDAKVGLGPGIGGGKPAPAGGTPEKPASGTGGVQDARGGRG